ncbi:MAG: hypothetical protein KatS3mg121_0280 [Gammaproteobacteria bacterium]|nr:MAG: hypothetical protein KatS3mg121_0280 [Gammaproteobacteria bacterium]
MDCRLGLASAALRCLASGLVVCCALAGRPAAAQDAVSELQGIDDQVQALKQEVLDIERELSLLEEKLLFPSGTQVAVFVSLADAEGFELDAVELAIDGAQAAAHLYAYREFDALRRGGVQRLHVANLPAGRHRLAVAVRGRDRSGGAIEARAEHVLEKGDKPAFVELRLRPAGGGVDIDFREW